MHHRTYGGRSRPPAVNRRMNEQATAPGRRLALVAVSGLPASAPAKARPRKSGYFPSAPVGIGAVGAMVSGARS